MTRLDSPVLVFGSERQQQQQRDLSACPGQLLYFCIPPTSHQFTTIMFNTRYMHEKDIKEVERLVDNCLFLWRAPNSPLRDAGHRLWGTAVVSGRTRVYERTAAVSEEIRPHISWAWVEYSRLRRAGKFIGLSPVADGRSAATVTAMRYTDLTTPNGTIQVSRYEVHIAVNSLKAYNAWLVRYTDRLRKGEVNDTTRTAEVADKIREFRKVIGKMMGE